ncbi:MAG: hypothetical protein JXN60_01705 [Lentisphaerae bacterium]|nr:hypothetical protein [Lentisphaerota bacterium]
MKIPLNMGKDPSQSSKAAQARELEKNILAAQKGDWTAKNNLFRTYSSLINSLAKKRAQNPGQMNNYIELGKEGLFKAARKYKPSVSPERFQIFALDFIEASMDGSGGGFLSRLFGK